MEKKVTKIYRKSATGITKKWNTFMSESASKVSKYQTAYNDAIKSDNQDLIKSTKKTLQNAITEQTLGNSYYRSMVDDVTTKLSQVNQTALAYVNGEMPSVYTKNFNFIDKNTQSVLATNGVNFTLVDEHVVKRRVTEGDITLPKKKVDIPKDKKWNTKQLNSSVLQGILQGESMDDISKRILPVVDNNENAAIRNARTMVTGAENQGRLDRYKDLESKGAIIKKVWMATGDHRTRDWHLVIDGQEKDLDDMFVDGHGNELEMPGDPNAVAETIYNCRCTTKSKILGFRKSDGTVNLIDYDYSQDEESLHSKEIKSEKNKRTTGSGGSDRKVVNGTDISSTWTRRSDQFDFEIEDVINAQGFDGLPKVVSADEFDEAVKESNIIMQRAYNAPDQETLNAYQNELYNGKWYVDCSTGGASYGQGMYAMANYNGEIDDKMNHFMSHYSQRFNKEGVSMVETFTLDPSAKGISYDDLLELRNKGGLESVQVKNHISSIFEERNIDYNKDMLTCVTAMYDTKYVDLMDAMSAMRNLDKSQKSIVEEIANELKQSNYTPVKIDAESESTLAVLLGYDYIFTRDYVGEAVILNRTKVIFKRS